jgi:SAM-dependent methyltransferase
VQIGADHTGADLSLPMMEVLRKKIAAIPERAGRLRLAIAGRDSPAVCQCHLRRDLVSDWRQTLRECRRALRDGGWLVLSSNERAARKQRDVTASRTPDGPSW